MQSNLMWTLKQLNLALEQYGREQMKDMGITPTQGIVLHYLLSQKNRNVYAIDLHTALGISKSAISSTLKSLKQKGYVMMVENPTDDRKKQIVLTDKTFKAEKRIASSLTNQKEYLCRGISEQHMQQMEFILKTMLSNLTTSELNNEKEEKLCFKHY